MARIRVLLVEDNRLLREGVTAMLNEHADIKAVAATGNGDALEKVKKLEPQVVLLDMDLSSESSLRIAESIKTQFPSTEVVVMDLVPVQADVVEFVKAGVSGFILKDATLDDVLHTIRSVAEGKKILPLPLAGSLFSQIAEHAIKRGNTSELFKMVRLTRREHEIVALITAGRSNKEIAGELRIAIHTVKSHVHNIFEKLALHTRLELASFAHKGGLAREAQEPVLSGRTNSLISKV